jgi:hypothetical protein
MGTLDGGELDGYSSGTSVGHALRRPGRPVRSLDDPERRRALVTQASGMGPLSGPYFNFKNRLFTGGFFIIENLGSANQTSFVI